MAAALYLMINIGYWWGPLCYLFKVAWKVFWWMVLFGLILAGLFWVCANWEGVLGLVLLCGMAGGSSTRRRVGYKSPTLEIVKKPYPSQNHPLPADTIYRYC